MPHPLKASRLLTYGKKAGSHTRFSSWHARTHERPSVASSNCMAERGGQQGGAVTLGAQTIVLVLGNSTKGLGGLPGQDFEAFTGGKRASG